MVELKDNDYYWVYSGTDVYLALYRDGDFMFHGNDNLCSYEEMSGDKILYANIKKPTKQDFDE